MKVTPLEIRQKSFEKVFRGYDKDEVDAFLLSLSQEWEKIIEENKNLKISLDASQKEVQKLRDVESSLFKTLKTAEDTGANLVEQASREAELTLKETGLKSDKIVSEAKTKAIDIISNAGTKSRQILEEMIGKVKEIERQYDDIKQKKDDLLSGLKNYTRELSEKLDKFEQLSNKESIQNMVESAKDVYNEGFINNPVEKEQKVEEEEQPATAIEEPESSTKPEPVIEQKEEEIVKEKIVEEPPEKKPEEGSFFDELE